MFEHLSAQLEITKKKLNLYARIINIASQLIFIGFYIYNLIIHLDVLYKIIIYSVLLLLVLFAFVLEIISYLNDSEKFKTFHLKNTRLVFWIKYIINVSVLAFSFYEYFKPNSTDNSNFRLVILLVTATVYILSVAIQVIKDIAITEGSALYVAAKMDMENNWIGSVLNQFNVDVRNAPRIANEGKIRENMKSLVSHDENYYQVQDANKGGKAMLKTGMKILSSFKEYNNKQYSLRLQSQEGLKVEFAKVTPKALAIIMKESKINKFVGEIRSQLDSYPEEVYNYVNPIFDGIENFLKVDGERKNTSDTVRLIAALLLISKDKNMNDIRNISTYALTKGK